MRAPEEDYFPERRREPRYPAGGRVEILWRDPDLGLQRFSGDLRDDSVFGCAVAMERLPKRRTRVCIDQDGSRRWGQVRFSGWEAGRSRVGLEFDGEALVFDD